MVKNYYAAIDSGDDTKPLSLEVGDILNCEIFDRNGIFTNVKTSDGWIYRLFNDTYEIVETETSGDAPEGTVYLSEYGVYIDHM